MITSATNCQNLPETEMLSLKELAQQLLMCNCTVLEENCLWADSNEVCVFVYTHAVYLHTCTIYIVHTHKYIHSIHIYHFLV
jgi:hypothetical protein